MKRQWSFLLGIVACEHCYSKRGNIKATLYIFWLIPVFSVEYN